jgi:hypothetical protein
MDELTPQRARERLIALLGQRDVRIEEVTDLSAARARVETSYEFRSIRRVVRDEPEQLPTDPVDLEPALWALAATPDDPFVDEPRWTLDEPRSGKLTPCPTCGAKGSSPCPTCGGTTRAPCESCRGMGTVVDARGRTSGCRFCKGERHMPCRACALGEVPCVDCDRTGEAFTIQQVTVRWTTRRDTRVVATSLPELPIENLGYVPTRVLHNESGPVDPAQIAQLEAPQRAAVEQLRASLSLEGTSARVRSQTVVIERIPVYSVRFTLKGRARHAHLAGRSLEPLGLEVPGSRSSVVMLSLVLAGGIAVVLALSALFR